KGLAGDRYASANGKRQVTLLQWEHLNVIGSFAGMETVAPEWLRRNIVVAGINLLALKTGVSQSVMQCWNIPACAIPVHKWKHGLVLVGITLCVATVASPHASFTVASSGCTIRSAHWRNERHSCSYQRNRLCAPSTNNLIPANNRKP